MGWSFELCPFVFSKEWGGFMGVLDRLVELALEKSRGVFIEDFRIGLGLTAVKLSDGSCGVAYSLREDLLGTCEEFSKEGVVGYEPLLSPGVKASDFVREFMSDNPIAKSLGLATINALLNRDEYSKGDVMEYLEYKEGCTACLVGHIPPIAVEFMAKGCDVLVFDRNRKEGILPDWAVRTHLKRCDVVVISASSVANGTIEWVLEHVNTEEVAIVGPSAPMVRGIFPVKVIGGIRIIYPEKVLEAITRGVGTRGLYSLGYAEKVNLLL